jgi:glycosyltransferase involved in cell wall biosynthesis
VAQERFSVLPNAIHMDSYGMGPKDPALVARYGLQGRKVVMTLARYASNERYKGVDEVLAVLPRVLRQVPEVTYLVVGDGTDRPRLESVCRSLGLAPHVVFTGRIPEAEKADYFRLADAFVMPSRGEGFGFVFLEAMACGIPVVGGRNDGSADALGDGAFGRLVDPANAEELEAAILEALGSAKAVPRGMEMFSYENFERKCRRMLARASLLCG